jgi:hypothetical protein
MTQSQTNGAPDIEIEAKLFGRTGICAVPPTCGGASRKSGLSEQIFKLILNIKLIASMA